MTTPEDSTAADRYAGPTGPGATGGLPGDNSTADSESPVEETRDTVAGGGVAPVGDPDAR